MHLPAITRRGGGALRFSSFLGGFLALAFLCTWFVPLAHAETTSDVPTGCDFEVTADAGSTYSFANDVLTLSGGTYTLSMAPGKESTEQTISITGESVITLNGVNLNTDLRGSNTTPISIAQDAMFDVTLNLPDDVKNVFQTSGSRSYNALINKPQTSEALGGKLVIQANGAKKNGQVDFAGDMIAIGSVEYDGAANPAYTSNIEITGGVYTCKDSLVGAEGGSPSSAAKATAIKISGAAIRHSSYERSIIYSSGEVTNSSVSGNTVVVGEITGSTAVADPFPGTTVEQAIVFWKPSASSEWTSNMYGSAVEVPNDVEFPANLTLPVSASLSVAPSATLSVAAGATLTVSETATFSATTGGSVAVAGTVENKGTITIPADKISCTGSGKVETQLVYDTQGGQFVPVNNADDKPSDMRVYKDATLSTVHTYGVLPTATLTDKQFDGWYYLQDETKVGITKDSAVVLNAHDMYATWIEPVVPVSLTLVASPGTFASTGKGTLVKINLTPKSTIDLSAIETPVRSGYVFTGWYTEAGEKAADDYTVPLTDSMLVASWASSTSTVSLTFVASPGTFASTGLYTLTKTGLTPAATFDLSSVEAPTYDGGTFMGWYTADGAKADDAYKVPGNDSVLIANWDIAPAPTPTPDPEPEPTPDPAPEPSPAEPSGWEWTDEGWTYVNEDGSKDRNGWVAIDGSWYYFGDNGVIYENCWAFIDGEWYGFWAGGQMCTGWVWDSGYQAYFYCGPSGAMVHGVWAFIDGEWYGFWANGTMCTGWIWDSGYNAWFYCYSNGVMARNTWVDGYYLNDSGVCL